MIRRERREPSFNLKRLPVDVDEGTPDTGDDLAYIVTGLFISPQTHTPACGISNNFGGHASNIYYEQHMDQAQFALNIQIKTANDLKAVLAKPDLITAIGTGVGVSSAHEIAHHYLLERFGMDNGSPNTYNGGDCDGLRNPLTYTGEGIIWEKQTHDALKKILGSGWHD